MENFIRLVDVLAWPAIVLILCVLLRQPLSKLLGLIETVKYKGAEVAFRSDDRSFDDIGAKDLLSQFWRPNDQRNLENEAKLRTWLQSHGITLSITSFLNAAHLDATRRKAVKELQLESTGAGGEFDGRA